MANGHGGYRKPEHPATVSGPGKYARRTDGGPAQVMSAAPGQAYGDAKAQLDSERAAPMGAATPPPQAAQAASSQPQMPPYQGGDFAGPSARPGVPVTHGVDIGPGADSSALTLPSQPSAAAGNGSMTALLTRLSASDTTGILASLLDSAANRNA